MRSIVSIGNFDGLHLGHVKLLEETIKTAKSHNLRSIIITFDTQPAFTLNKDAKALLLMPMAEKKRQMLEMGIGHVEAIHFDVSFAKITADEFLHEYLIPQFDPQIIVVGYDSHFGFERRGDFGFLQSHQAQYGYELKYVEPLMHSGSVISSSLIRNLLLNGNIEEANSLLSSPYTLYGKVIHGIHFGSKLGFPTANIELSDPHQLVPKNGIYLSRLKLDTEQFFGLTIIGVSPTVKQSGIVEIEAHILDFNQQIYGTYLQIELLGYLREEKLFNSFDDLKLAISDDIAKATAIIKERYQ